MMEVLLDRCRGRDMLVFSLQDVRTLGKIKRHAAGAPAMPHSPSEPHHL